MGDKALPLLMVAATVATGGVAAPALAGATAAGAAGAATAGAGSLFTLANVGTALSIGSSLFGAYSSYQSGKQEAQAYAQQADMERMRAMQDESNRQARLTEILNNQMAQTAGRGVQIGSGSDIAIATFSEQEAKRESDIASLDSTYRVTQLKSQSAQARKSGISGLISGVSKAGKTGFNAYNKAQERKVTTV